MTYARRTDRELRVRRVESGATARTRARGFLAAGLIVVAAGGWPRSADAHVEPELMGAVRKAAEGGEAGNAAARAARAAGNAETGGVARFALIVGVNRGVDPELPQLHYADDDAARYSELFGALGVRVHLLTRADENTRRISADAIREARPPVRAELARAVAELAREVATARELGRRVVFYFIYAGHGNASGNTAYLALEDQRLDTGDIERQIVDRVHANETHLIVDVRYDHIPWRTVAGLAASAARSGRSLRPRGWRADPTWVCCCRPRRRRRATSGPISRPESSVTRFVPVSTAPPTSTETAR